LWYDGTPNKTVYDPCPVGWRVPYFKDNISPWNGLYYDNHPWVGGFNFINNPNMPSAGYYPGYGVRNSYAGALYSSDLGNYWSASPKGVKSYYFNTTIVFFKAAITNYLDRANGYSVRCVKI